MLALAGPGTGKTESITNRVVRLIEDGRANGDQDIHQRILVITFTKKAARELLMRISEKLAEVNLDEMYISTFHAFCERAMREFPELHGSYSRNARILDEKEQVFFIQKHIRTEWQEKNGRKFPVVVGFGEDDKKCAASMKEVMDYLGVSEKPTVFQTAQTVCQICDKLLDEAAEPGELLRSSDPKTRTRGEMLTYYLKTLAQKDIHVFATLQYTLLAELKKNSALLSDRFEYIIVDEYQDTNRIQTEIVELIAGKKQNIMAVGDDDQSIYRFRGAAVENILGFAQKHPGCETVVLDRNFRSTQEIIDFYTKWMHTDVIAWNGRRYEKQLIAERGSVMGSVCCICDTVQKNWMEQIFRFVTGLKESGRITDYNQIVYLCNSVTNKRIKALQGYLTDQGVPVYSPRSLRFFDRDEIRLAIGCLLTILSAPRKNSRLAQMQDHAGSVMKKTPALNSKVLELKKDFGGEKKYSRLLYRLFACEPFKSHLNADIGSQDYETLLPARNLAALSRMLVSYEKLNPGLTLGRDTSRFVYHFLIPLCEKGAGEYEDECVVLPPGYLSFMTIHQSKGLEFPIVIVDLPGSVLCYDDAALCDVMRKYYTAFSRARNLLVLSGVKPDSIFDGVLKDVPSVDDAPIGKMTFDGVKAAETVDSFAFTSDIEEYEKCPLRYKLYRMLGFAPSADDTPKTLVGTLVHQTVEDINLRAMRQEIPDGKMIGQLFDANVKSLENASCRKFSQKERQNACDSVMRYYNYVEEHYGKNNPKLKWGNIEGAEKNVSLPKTVDGRRYYMKGSIDIIRGYEKYYTIIDIKTGEKTPEKIAEYRRQLRIYASLLRKLADGRETRMQLFFTSEGSKDRPLDIIRYADELKAGRIEAEEKKFAETVLKIMEKRQQDFLAVPKKETVCGFCDFCGYCGKD